MIASVATKTLLKPSILYSQLSYSVVEVQMARNSMNYITWRNYRAVTADLKK